MMHTEKKGRFIKLRCHTPDTSQLCGRQGYRTVVMASSVMRGIRHFPLAGRLRPGQLDTIQPNTIQLSDPLPRYCQRSITVDSDPIPSPLRAWLQLEQSGDDPNLPLTSRLLVPSSFHLNSQEECKIISSSEELVNVVNEYYDCSKEQFVGGMGESDPGVALLGYHGDALRALLNENGWLSQALPEIQRQRHGVPLHLYTNGLGLDICQHHSDVLGMISTLQVSLWAASPPDYVKSLKEANVAAKASEFGQICNTIATVVEMGVAVHLSVLPPFRAAAHDLAPALGAREVHVVDPSSSS